MRAWAALDVGVCAAITIAAMWWTLDTPEIGTPGPFDTLVIPLVTLPLLLRRRAPLAAAILLGAGMLLSALPTLDHFRCGPADVAMMMIVYMLGTRLELSRALIGVAVLVPGLACIGATDPVLDGDVLGFLAFETALLVVILAVGRFVRSMDRLATTLAERTRLLAQRRELNVGLAVEVERERLSGDLDETARARILGLVEMAEAPSASFAGIETEGRATLNEMRGLLGVLRSDERPAEPCPTLADVDRLLDSARRRGRQIAFEIEGLPCPLPDGVELAAVRTIQHGVATVGDCSEPVSVRVAYTGEALALDITGGFRDDIALAAARERVAAFGGKVLSGVDDGVISVRLPILAYA